MCSMSEVQSVALKKKNVHNIILITISMDYILVQRDERYYKKGHETSKLQWF